VKITVLSPHVDDAVFSLAESMLTWIEDGHEVTVLSVFAGIPWHDEEGRRKHTVLRAEHDRAMERLGVAHVELEFLDDVYGPSLDPEVAASNVAVHVAPTDQLVVPVGIHHNDHLLTRRIGGVLRPRDWLDRTEAWFYDEIPYYVLYPSCAGGIFSLAKERQGYRSHYQEKTRLIHEYRSQLNDDLMRCLLVPERVWC
jgi:LmbE family N-acetylglucosaminyl deacetylase